MCTVTFIPTPTACYITSNRDESPGRQSTGLTSRHNEKWNAIHYPLDETSGGSWIALADTGRAVCLLNGAYEAFILSPPYRLSRGIVVAETAAAEDALAYLKMVSLEGVAPFTLLVYEPRQFHQLIWDGEKKELQELSVTQPQIWSSVTLYPPDVRRWRKSLFDDWIQQTSVYDQASIIQFHKMANGDKDNDFIMNRHNIVRTLSITSIVLNSHKGSMLHLSLDEDKREEIMITYAD